MLKIMLAIILLFTPTLLTALECPIGFKRPSYPTRATFCSVGMMVPDAYNFDNSILCEDMEVDHLIPLKLAHCLGVDGERLRDLANDKRNLKFTYWRTNRIKGAKGLFEFASTLPDEMRERVIIDGLEVMEAYELPIDKNLRRSLLSIARSQTDRLKIKSKLLENTIPSTVKFKGKNVNPKKAIRETSQAISARTAKFAVRELSVLPMEHLPLAGLIIAVAFMAWDLDDACSTTTDLAELEKALFPDETVDDDMQAVCGLEVPSLEELRDKISDREALMAIYDELKKQAADLNLELQLPEIPDLPDLDDTDWSDITKIIKRWGD